MDVSASIPTRSTPFLSTNGAVNEVWLRFLLQLYFRTGSAKGVDADQLVTQITNLINTADTNGDVPLADDIGRRLGALESQIQNIPLVVQRVIQDMGFIPTSAPVSLSAMNESATSMRRHFDPGMTPSHGFHDDPELHALATPASHGFMSADDKAKLDSL